MRQRGGAALAAVLFAIALTSALMVGGLYASRSMVASARFSRTAFAIEAPAERALIMAVAQWDSAARAAQPPGTQVASPELIDGVAVTTWTTRLSARTWWLVAETTRETAPGFHRRIGLLVHDTAGVVSVVPGPAWAQLP